MRRVNQRAAVLALLAQYPRMSNLELRYRLAAQGIDIKPCYCRQITSAVRGRLPPLLEPRAAALHWTPEMLDAVEHGARVGMSPRALAERLGVAPGTLTRGVLLAVRRLMDERDERGAGWQAAAE